MASAPPDHNAKLAKGLNKLRGQKELCDVTITVGNRDFDAHKNVLAADSKYFSAMFKHGFKEGKENKVKIDGKPEIFELLLDFMYTGKLEITEQTIYDVLEMANYMQLKDATEECSKFAKTKFNELIQAKYSRWASQDVDQVEVVDVFKICKLASQSGLKRLAQDAGRYLCEQFQELKSLDLFLESASWEFLRQFLRRKELSSQDEEKEVLEMVVKWLKHDWDGRSTYAASLLKEVRLGLVPEESLQELLDAAFLKISEVKRLYQEATEGLKSGRGWSELAQEMPNLFATRSTITAPIAFSSGEYSKDTEDNKCFYYDVDQHRWKSLGNFNSLEFCPSFVVADGSLFAVSGLHKTPICWIIDNPPSRGKNDEYEGIKRMDFHCPPDYNFLQYNDKKNCWDDLPSLGYRHHVEPVCLDGSIYALGGVPEERRYSMTDVECYNLKTKEWKDMASLPEEYKHGYMVSSAVAYKGKILVYVVGEHEGRGKWRSGKQVILAYDPSTDVWETKLTEDDGQVRLNEPVPILFVHKGVCYKVSSHVPYQSLYDHKDVRSRPTVNVLDIGEDVATITLGKEIGQDLIPQNTVGAFFLKNEIFVNIKGSVFKTDIKVKDGQKRGVNLSKWKNLGSLKNRQSNIISYTFDKKKLEDYDEYDYGF